MILLVDMDGVLADFDAFFFQRCIENGWTLDVDEPSQQTFRYFADHMPDRDERNAARQMVHDPGWFRSLPVVAGAEQGMEEFERVGWEVHICSKPLDASATCADEKRAWLRQHFPTFADRLILAPDKSLVKGDVLLDDAPKPKWFARADWVPIVFTQPHNVIGHLAEFPHWTWGDDPLFNDMNTREDRSAISFARGDDSDLDNS